jgi:hypothetical protein
MHIRAVHHDLLTYMFSFVVTFCPFPVGSKPVNSWLRLMCMCVQVCEFWNLTLDEGFLLTARRAATCLSLCLKLNYVVSEIHDLQLCFHTYEEKDVLNRLLPNGVVAYFRFNTLLWQLRSRFVIFSGSNSSQYFYLVLHTTTIFNLLVPEFYI